MAHSPLYGVLVIGELPHEADHRSLEPRQGAGPPPPNEGRLRRALSRWMRRLRAIRDRVA
jgi:hypothetical protein